MLFSLRKCSKWGCQNFSLPVQYCDNSKAQEGRLPLPQCLYSWVDSGTRWQRRELWGPCASWVEFRKEVEGHQSVWRTRREGPLAPLMGLEVHPCSWAISRVWGGRLPAAVPPKRGVEGSVQHLQWQFQSLDGALPEKWGCVAYSCALSVCPQKGQWVILGDWRSPWWEPHANGLK